MSDSSAQPSRLEEQCEFFANRLKKRHRHLWKWAKRVGTNAFRVYHKDIPEIPFAVDWYDGHLHISEYERPHTRTPDEHQEWVNTMVDTAAKALGVAPQRTFVKQRAPQRGHSQYDTVARTGYTLWVEENELRFKVNLSDYIDTGLFLDHRDLRLWAAKRAAGAEVLNLFCYTGAFTCYAAAGGARSTLSVDLSNTYLDWAQENLAGNGLMDARHEFLRADALGLLPELATAGRRFDLIILDPPTFSNSKKMSGTLDVQRDHVEMINNCLRLLTPQGLLVFATNRRHFQLETEQLNARSIYKLTKLTMPEDFKGTNIHMAWAISEPLQLGAPAGPLGSPAAPRRTGTRATPGARHSGEGHRRERSRRPDQTTRKR